MQSLQLSRSGYGDCSAAARTSCTNTVITGLALTLNAYSLSHLLTWKLGDGGICYRRAQEPEPVLLSGKCFQKKKIKGFDENISRARQNGILRLVISI